MTTWVPRLLHLARGWLTQRSWGRRLLMTRVLPLCRGERLRAWRLLRLWRAQGWRPPPPHVVDAGGVTSGRDIRAMTSPTIIDVDPISARPTGAVDLVRDQPQINWAPEGPGTSGAQLPQSSSSSPRLPRRAINWNHTPWQDDWFEDNEDMQALWTSIVTINSALTVCSLQCVVVT
jgi:hypothetical protein